MKLRDLGLAGNGTNWEFYFKNNLFLTRFFFNTKSSRVDFEIKEFQSENEIVSFLGKDYGKNNNRFLISEVAEDANFPEITIPLLLSTSCRDLANTLKVYFKNHDVRFFLYDPVELLEFEYFLKICYKYGGDVLSEDKVKVLIERNKSFGGLLRPTFNTSYKPISAISSLDNNTILALHKWTPLNISSAVNTLVGAKFNLSLEFKGGKDEKLKSCHLVENWRLEYLTDEIAFETGKRFSRLPSKISNQEFLFQIQESANIIGGPLRNPNVPFKLPPGYSIEDWSFYECSPKLNVSESSTKQNSAGMKCLSDCGILDSESQKDLIKLLPNASIIKIFKGATIEIPFSKLSTNFVYRANVHNGRVFDSMTADPVHKRLFMFQSTTSDPYEHKCGIPALLSALNVMNPSGINEIYFFMVTSAHVKSCNQHLFNFSLPSGFGLHCCHLSEYASSRKLFDKLLFVDSKFRSELMPALEVNMLDEGEKTILKTISGCYRKEKKPLKQLKVKHYVVQELRGRFTEIENILKKEPAVISVADYNILARFMRCKMPDELKVPIIDCNIMKSFLNRTAKAMQTERVNIDGLLKKLEMKSSSFSSKDSEIMSSVGVVFNNGVYYFENVVVENFSRFYLTEKDMESFRKFLDLCPKLKPFICRAPFMSTPSIEA